MCDLTIRGLYKPLVANYSVVTIFEQINAPLAVLHPMVISQQVVEKRSKGSKLVK
jgi:hypothetical protein